MHNNYQRFNLISYGVWRWQWVKFCPSPLTFVWSTLQRSRNTIQVCDMNRTQINNTTLTVINLGM